MGIIPVQHMDSDSWDTDNTVYATEARPCALVQSFLLMRIVQQTSALLRNPALVLCLVLTVFFANNLSLPAQPIVNFSHYSVEQGLSQSNAFRILQDKRGFLWIATQDGLNRFDGYTFTIFRNTTLTGSIADSHVQALYEDNNGMLWVGTKSGGLSVFDYTTEKFTNFGNGASANTPSEKTIGSDVRAIVEDTNGELWLATNDGLGKFDRTTRTVIAYKNLGVSPLSNEMYALAADKEGSLWIGTAEGLLKFSLNSGTAALFSKELAHSKVYSLLLGKSTSQLWIGTENGLSVLERESQRFTTLRQTSPTMQVFSVNSIRALCEDRQGKLWLGTYGGGLLHFDPLTQTFTAHKAEDTRTASLSNNFIISLYEDRSGVIWAGSYGSGVNKYDPALAKFTTYQRNPHNPAPISNHFVYSFLEDRKGTLWVGTSNGLNKLANRTTGEFVQYFPGMKSDGSNPLNTIRAIYEDTKGMLWLATGKGLVRFNPTDGRSTIFNPPHTNPGIPDTNSFSHAIVADNDGMLWLGTMGAGIYRFNPASGKFIAHYTHEQNNENSLAHNYIFSLNKDNKGDIWIATNGGGVCRFKPSIQEFTNYKHNSANPGSLSNNIVRSVYQDRSGRVWFGTAGGLNRFDAEKQTFIALRDKDGLPNNVIYGILEDNSGNLWLSTNKGLSRYTPDVSAKSDEKSLTRMFHNFDAADGLQNNEFNTGAYYKGASGRMYFGGIRGFNEFFPDSIRNNAYMMPVIITGLRKRDIPVVLPQSISIMKEIEIPAQDNVISFQFTALNFTLPEKNVYAYKLEGFDENWQYCGTRREVTYTNLSGGTYILRVKAANNDGVWNEEGTALRVAILPYWYLRWWAIVIWAGLAGAAAFAVYKWRVKTIEETNRLLQKTVDERTQEVQRQITILNELAQEIELANMELQDRNSQVENRNVQFAEINQQLNEKNQLLDQTLEELHSLNQELESRIQERTIELKQAKEALENALVQEQEINTLRARLIASISHEFRTPITVIQSSCGILQRYIDKMSSDQRQKQFGHIEESSKRLVSILDAVITMSTIENRQLRLMPADVVRRTEELVRDFNVNQAQEFGENAHIITFAAETETLVMNIDEESLRQVLSNVLSNAVKFSPPKTTVEVTFKQKSDTVVWSVKDAGMGIADEDMPYVFDLFYRSEKTESSTIQGVGLGLSIVNKLIEIMRGEVWFETEVGNGTTFFVEIPILQRGTI
jgi:ligand-binding sensor domain-containing protein/signal transduction histidine kinase